MKFLSKGVAKPASEPRPTKENTSAVYGYIMIALGIIGFAVLFVCHVQEPSTKLSPNAFAIAFLVVMIGFAFVYPDLLRDQQKNLSTMRIIVFMMTCALCTLILKLGLGKEDFGAIGMNGYWVTIIGFVFGGKVAQSYIENKFQPNVQSPTPSRTATPSTTDNTVTSETAGLAANQNRTQLQTQFPNIASVSDTVSDANGATQGVVALYVTDGNTSGMPSALIATLGDGSTVNVPTEIISNVGDVQIQSLQDSQIVGAATPHEIGSIGCMVSSSDDTTLRGVLTSGHIYSNGNSDSVGKIIDPANRKAVDIAGINAAAWYFQLISAEQDLAVAALNSDYTAESAILFKGCFYDVNDSDVGKTKVTLVSAIRHTRQGYILDHNYPRSVPYKDNIQVPFTNIILIGSAQIRDDSHPVSEDGDSGGAVFVNDGVNNQLVGLILGRDNKFTYVLPIKETLNDWDFNLL